MCTAAAWNARATADACTLSTACYRIAAIVDARGVHAPVTPLVWSIVRESPKGCKGFASSVAGCPRVTAVSVPAMPSTPGKAAWCGVCKRAQQG